MICGSSSDTNHVVEEFKVIFLQINVMISFPWIGKIGLTKYTADENSNLWWEINNVSRSLGLQALAEHKFIVNHAVINVPIFEN